MSNRIDQRIDKLSDKLRCLAREVCSLSSNIETDPIFSDSPAFNITDPNIANWNTAFSWGNHSGIYLPIVGGTLTGTNGNGYLGLINQTSNPATPSEGVRLFSNAANTFSWRGQDGYIRSTTSTLTANRTFTFPDVSGQVILDAGTQSITGLKTFSGSRSASSGVASGTIFSTALTATANNDVLAALNIAPTFTNGAFTGTGNYGFWSQPAASLIGSNGNAGRLLFARNDGVTTGLIGYSDGTTLSDFVVSSTGGAGTFGIIVGTIRTFHIFNGGNVKIQGGGTFNNNGYRFDVSGTTRLGGDTTLTGNVIFTTDNTYSIGSGTTNRASVVYTPIINAGTTLTFRSAATSSIQFQKTGGSDVTMVMFGSTNNWYVQNAASIPTESNYRFTINGSGATAGALYILNGNIKIDSLSVYADNAAALSGGLVVNQLYKLADGTIKIVV